MEALYGLEYKKSDYRGIRDILQLYRATGSETWTRFLGSVRAWFI